MSKVKRFVIGITGGIASGKSSVLTRLARKGIPTISSDELAHQCIRKGQPAYKSVIRAFGREIVDKSGEINRKALGKRVFAQPSLRKRLERIIHPHVIRRLKQFAKQYHSVVAMDIPLLFEARLGHLVDCKVVVFATRSQQLKRMIARDRLSKKDCLDRLKAQWPLSRKRALADYVIFNTGNKDHLKKQLDMFLKSGIISQVN